jgi:hypothetical protein
MLVPKLVLVVFIGLASLTCGIGTADAQEAKGWSFVERFERLFGPWSVWRNAPSRQAAVAIDDTSGNGAVVVRCVGRRLDMLVVLDGRARLLNGHLEVGENVQPRMETSIRFRAYGQPEKQFYGRLIGDRFIEFDDAKQLTGEIVKSDEFSLGLTYNGVQTVLEFKSERGAEALKEIIAQCDVPVT